MTGGGEKAGRREIGTSLALPNKLLKNTKGYDTRLSSNYIKNISQVYTRTEFGTKVLL